MGRILILAWWIFWALYWFETWLLIASQRLLPAAEGAIILLIVPVLEELARWAGFRLVRKNLPQGWATLLLTMAIATLEAVKEGFRIFHLVPGMNSLWLSLWRHGLLSPHLGLWAIWTAGGYRPWALPIAILAHMAWNAWVRWDGLPEAIALAGYLGPSIAAFIYLICREAIWNWSSSK